MDPYYEDESVTLHLGDCIDVMRGIPDASVDAIVTDPPYGLGFMGKAWDDLPPGLPWAQEYLRVLKPGGHLLAFGGTRTWHRLACAVEDAGFEIRDSIAWLYGSGFPKSLDVSKAIDKAAGATREVVGNTAEASGRTIGLGASSAGGYEGGPIASGHCRDITAPATPAAQQWQGWGTALKPAFEPIVVARKPLVGTVAANVLAHGTGALNIDGCRVETNGERFGGGAKGSSGFVDGYDKGAGFVTSTAGRWPTNVVLDGDAADELDATGPHTKDGVAVNRNRDGGRKRATIYGDFGNPVGPDVTYGGEGGPSRYFPAFREEDTYEDDVLAALDEALLTGKPLPTFRYQAKAPTRERVKVDGIAHPTVKPLALMRWLVRLVTPPGGVVLEPFAGSGTTVEAAVLEGFRCVAIEREADYLPLILARLERNRVEPDLPTAAEALALFDFEEPA